MKKNCYNCKHRQREVKPVRRLICSLRYKVVDKDDVCKKFEKRI